MTSREIVQRTLDYASPERLARSFGDSDFSWAGCKARTKATEWKQTDESRWERLDEWGNTWARLDPTSKGEVVRGALQDWDALPAHRFPDYSRPEDYAGVAESRRANPDKWLLGSMPGFTFNVARYMRRMETYLTDLLLERDRVRELHNRIDEVLAHMIRNFARAGVDGVMFPEDWGTQTQTLISPALWREEFFPRFRNLCGIAAEAGIRVFMHSCGRIGPLVPGLMEAGIAVLQFDQPDLHGLANLAAHQQRGHITFWCPVDIQQTLQTRDEARIRAKAREMLDTLWLGRGGFIAGRYGDEKSIGLDPKWQDCACDEFVKWGEYSKYTQGVEVLP
jgi:hypothetical protein